jgi:hypothetical protein
MTPTSRPKPGTFVRVPLADGSVAYGRILGSPYMAFYEYRTPTPSDDLEVISAKPLLFRQAVRLRGAQRWPVIGWQELDDAVAEPVVRFTQDVFDFRKCTIFDSTGAERDAEPEECIGLERSAVWDMHHIEQRLLDTFAGRPNVAEVLARVRLE